MSDDVVFEENDSIGSAGTPPTAFGSPKGMFGLLISLKIAKDVKQAEQILVWLAIGVAILAVVVFVLANGTSERTATPAQIQELNSMRVIKN